MMSIRFRSPIRFGLIRLATVRIIRRALVSRYRALDTSSIGPITIAGGNQALAR